jgi:hypothetical protein
MGRIELAVVRGENIMKRLPAFYFLLSAASSVWAGQVDIPNQFEAGTTAVAAEVNANFSALETAVDDNAQQIDTNTQSIDANAQAIAPLGAAIGTAGISVKLDDVHIGRFVRAGRPPIEMPVDGGTELLAFGAVGLANTSQIDVLSDTGYRFSIVTADMMVGSRAFVEGELDPSPVFYDDTTCTGNRYFPVEGNTGFFTRFVPGVSDIRPAKPWAMRQGAVWGSPDPADPNPVYMIRRGQTVQTVPLLSFLIYSETLDRPFCIDATVIPGFDVNDSTHVNNTAFSVEPADAAVTGVADRLGGAITVGL